MNFIYEGRIDIVIGIEYVNFFENQYKTNFFIDLYIEYKRAWNNIREDKFIGKNSFIKRFNDLILSIKENKKNFEAIPINNCGDNEYWLEMVFIECLFFYILI